MAGSIYPQLWTNPYKSAVYRRPYVVEKVIVSKNNQWHEAVLENQLISESNTNHIWKSYP